MTSQALYLGLMVLVAGARLGEMLVCRRRRQGEAVRERIFPVMVVIHTALLVGAPVEVLALGRPLIPWLAGAAALVFVVAVLLRVWTLSTLGRHWNIRVVQPKAVVSGGPYRHIRHPNYLVVVLEILSLPLIHGAWLTALLLSAANGAVLVARLRTEEGVLMAIPEYRRAMGHKPRFLPRLRKSAPDWQASTSQERIGSEEGSPPG